MHIVSNAYKIAMKQNTIKRKLRGTINSGLGFNESHILAGSMSITNKISDGMEMKIGSVNIGELTATFHSFIPNWQGAVITLEEGLLIDGGTYEFIPMGTFTVSKAERSASGVAVTAYDNMSKFDKPFTLSTTSGKAYDFLQYACSSCDVVLGMTQAQVEALPNGNMLLGLWTENDIETFRDMLSWLAQTLACYATIDRNGKLVLRPYTSTITDDLDAYHRYVGEVYSTFETQYSGVSVVNIKDQTLRYKCVEPDTYLTYNLGSNPFLQYGSDTTKDIMLQNILDSIQNIKYTPFRVTIPCGGAYDLGDVLEFSGGIGDVTCCITNYTWRFFGSDNYTAQGDGKDPNLANARSKTDKNISGLLSRVSSDTFQYYIFRNLEAINIADTKTREIINVRFASLTSTIVIMEAEVLLDVDTPNTAVGVVTYYVDEAQDTEYRPTETWIDGNHILHLLYHINISEGRMNRFVATLTMNGGSAHIAPQGVQASIHGQGLAAIGEWDGYLDFRETIEEIDLSNVTVENNIVDVFTLQQDIPHRSSLTETLGEITLNGILLENNFEESLLVDKDAMSNYTHEQLTRWTHEDLANGFIHG